LPIAIALIIATTAPADTLGPRSLSRRLRRHHDDHEGHDDHETGNAVFQIAGPAEPSFDLVLFVLLVFIVIGAERP